LRACSGAVTLGSHLMCCCTCRSRASSRSSWTTSIVYLSLSRLSRCLSISLSLFMSLARSSMDDYRSVSRPCTMDSSLSRTTSATGAVGRHGPCRVVHWECMRGLARYWAHGRAQGMPPALAASAAACCTVRCAVVQRVAPAPQFPALHRLERQRQRERERERERELASPGEIGPGGEVFPASRLLPSARPPARKPE